ncbi:hypothetical protein N7537_000443 [Penicillium hordei]|uniref:Uncharacterized protein n=1 Tax=Penicillium hordei TaxID=40994 RepID=A0AAD6H876_9EURO|nr:uncharacterized protein N7537_000443 [Penicillium hordei]KAJ5615329.1 hypothetical protein N7537_000443 [Penicillium hordei]
MTSTLQGNLQGLRLISPALDLSRHSATVHRSSYYYFLSLLIFSIKDVYKINLKISQCLSYWLYRAVQSYLFTHGCTRDSSSMFMEQTPTQ